MEKNEKFLFFLLNVFFLFLFFIKIFFLFDNILKFFLNLSFESVYYFYLFFFLVTIIIIKVKRFRNIKFFFNICVLPKNTKVKQ